MAYYVDPDGTVHQITRPVPTTLDEYDAYQRATHPPPAAPPPATTSFWDQAPPPGYSPGGTFDERGTAAQQPNGPSAKTNGGGPPPLDIHNAASVNAFREYYGNQPGADPSLLSDPSYWNGKVMSGELGAEAGYIGQKMQSAWTGSGGSGMGFGGNGFTPLGSFQFGPAQFSQFSAPTVSAATPFDYQGPGLTAPPSFSFPGLYAPEAPKAAQAAAPVNVPPPPKNPQGEDGWVDIGNGGRVPANHPLAEQAIQQYQQAQTAYTQAQQAQAAQQAQPTAQPAPQGAGPVNVAGNITKGQSAPRNGPGAATPERARTMAGVAEGQMQPLGAAGGDNSAGSLLGLDIGRFQPTAAIPTPDTFQGPGGMPSAYQNANPFQYGQGVPQLGQFNYDPLTTPDTYTPGTFTAPDAAAMQQDPGYQFRVQQALDALQQSAASKGTLLSTGTQEALLAKAQEMASQEYQNVYNRRFGEFQQSEAEKAGAAQFNTGAQMAAQNQQYGQAANAFGLNADTALAQQAQGYGQAQNTAAFNEANRLNAYQAQLAGQNQQFGQAATTYGLNTDAQFRAAQAQADNSRQDYALDASTQAGLQGQAFGQALGQYQANAQIPLDYQNQQYNQAYNTWSGNAQNQLAAGQANAQAALSTNALNAQAQQAQYNANYQNAFNAYQSDVSQAQYAAGLGYQYAGLGLQAQNQNFNQGLATYNTNYQTQVADPFARGLALSQLGQNATQDTGNAGNLYGNAAGNLYTGQGNSTAAGQVGAANAWNSGLQGVADTAMQGLGYYYANNGRART